MDREPLLRLTDRGLYVPAADVYLDPWLPVPRAIVSHAHGDHLTRGCDAYLTTPESEAILRLRLAGEQRITHLPYGESLRIGGVNLSLHPAGHVFGSAQVRLERNGEVWVYTGDFKRHADPTCPPFELVRCHGLITESTFALPIFRWPDPVKEIQRIEAWWRENQRAGRASLLYVYPLGKAQRILASIDSTIGPIYGHGTVERIHSAYRSAGVALPPTEHATTTQRGRWREALILAPLSAKGTPWTRRFGVHSSGFASGWMRVRGTRRRRAVDRGFVLSDHTDWPGLLDTIRETGAETVWTTHGYSAVLARWAQENGLNGLALPAQPELQFEDQTLEIGHEED